MKEIVKNNKENMKKNIVKRQTGITLIALVITIIVLLILAGVSIAMLTGESGILTKVQEAKMETRGASVQEARDLWKINKTADKNSSTQTAQTLDELLTELKGQNLLTEDEVTTIKDTGKITIGSRTIIFGSDDLTLVEMFEKAEADGCTNSDGSCTNAEHLHIGDYVNYQNPTSGSYTSKTSQTGHEEDQVYEISSTKNQLNWRVLGKDSSTGGIKLIAGSPMKSNNEGIGIYFFMYGAKAYLNGEIELNKISSLYSSSLGTARSVKIEDINQITGVTTVDKIKEVNIATYYGSKQYGETYSYENQYTPESWLNNKTRTTVSGTVDGYGYYSINSKAENDTPSVIVTNDRAYKMLFNNVEFPSGACYWLASRGVYTDSSGAFFGVGNVLSMEGTTMVGYDGLFYSQDSYSNNYAAVRPVISLMPEASINEIQKINDKTEETWNYNYN